METKQTKAAATDQLTLLRILQSCGSDVLACWRERVQHAIPSAAAAGQPVLNTFIPVLYDRIAEIIAPGITRPFATDCMALLADSLCGGQHPVAYRADDLVTELQIFRSVIFCTAREYALLPTQEQCEQIGQLIDSAMLEAITECDAIDRHLRDSSIAELSHDLRNPLNVASALAQLIQRRPDNEKVAQMASRICEKIAETDAMIQHHFDLLGSKSTVMRSAAEEQVAQNGVRLAPARS